MLFRSLLIPCGTHRPLCRRPFASVPNRPLKAWVARRDLQLPVWTNYDPWLDGSPSGNQAARTRILDRPDRVSEFRPKAESGRSRPWLLSSVSPLLGHPSAVSCPLSRVEPTFGEERTPVRHQDGRLSPSPSSPAPGEDSEPIVRKQDRKSTRLNSSHIQKSRMPSSA